MFQYDRIKEVSRGSRRRRRAVVAAAAATACAAAVAVVPLSQAAEPGTGSGAGKAKSAYARVAQAGATLPFTSLEAEDAASEGQKIGPDHTQGTVASESSGRQAVKLGAGQGWSSPCPRRPTP